MQISQRSDERGAILIHVATAMLALLSIVAFAVDYGLLWVGRTQIQSAADAAALAGATSLAFDDPDDIPAAQESALAVGTANLVWGNAPDIQTTDVVVQPCNVLAPGVPNPSSSCVRVDAYGGALDRNGQTVRGPSLPTFFAHLFGVNDQGTLATATAQVGLSDFTNCLKPWAVPDRWQENQTGPWSLDDTFDKYGGQGANAGVLPNPDSYVAPTANRPGTGFTTADVGLQMVLKEATPQSAIAPGWFNAIDLPRASGTTTGAEKYRENIASCTSLPMGIGDILTVEPGNMTGPTRQGVQALIAQDSRATWNAQTAQVQNSCCSVSPRTVAIALFNPEVYADGRQSGRIDIVVSNLVGFFVAGLSGNDVIGYVTLYPGQATGEDVDLEDGSGFLRSVSLVR